VEDVLPSAIVIMISLLVVSFWTARLQSPEALYARVGFVVHVVASITLLYVMDHVFSDTGSDVHGYLQEGALLAKLMDVDLGRWGPQVVRCLFQREHDLPLGEGSSTASMSAITGLALFFLGNAPYAVNLLFAIMSFHGKWWLYVGLRDSYEYGAIQNRRILIATMFVPSAVFWSAGIVKESFALTGVGMLTLGLSRFLHGRRRVAGIAWSIAGVVTIGLFKPYLLFPFVIAAGAWYLTSRSRVSTIVVKPIYWIVGASIAAAGVALLSSAFPEYGIEGLGERVANQQTYGEIAGGGSYYSLGDPTKRSFAGQLAFAPLGLLTCLARPFVFEAHNFTSLIAALEITLLIALFVRAIVRVSMREMWRRVVGSPLVLFATLFTVLGATAVGLATTNFGTLSRYRVPLMPLYVFVILVLDARRVEEPVAEMVGERAVS
jgi:hypothetical protein